MRILFATIFYPPMHVGGTETYTHGLARALKQCGHDVRVLCAGNWGTGDAYWNGASDEIYQDVPVRRLHLNWAKAPQVNNFLIESPVIADYVESFLADWQPDLVHVTSCQTLSTSIIAAAKKAGVPVVVTLTDFWFLCPRVILLKSNGELCDGQTTPAECLECMLLGGKMFRTASHLIPKNILNRSTVALSHRPSITNQRGLRGMALDMAYRKTHLKEILAQADFVIAPSISLKELFVKNGFSIPIQVVHYGHDLTWLQDYHGKTSSSDIRFTYIGQTIPIKGVHLVIQAFKALRSHKNVKLSIYGDLKKDPAYAQELRALAADMPNISFQGTYDHARTGTVLEQSDVVIVPSLWHENGPLVIHEAFASKTPVIGTNTCGIAEFVHHDLNGLLFERGSAADLNRQMQRVVDEPELLKRFAAKISPVKTMDAEVSELVEIYRKVRLNHT